MSIGRRQMLDPVSKVMALYISVEGSATCGGRSMRVQALRNHHVKSRLGSKQGSKFALRDRRDARYTGA